MEKVKVLRICAGVSGGHRSYSRDPTNMHVLMDLECCVYVFTSELQSSAAGEEKQDFPICTNILCEFAWSYNVVALKTCLNYNYIITATFISV